MKRLILLALVAIVLTTCGVPATTAPSSNDALVTAAPTSAERSTASPTTSMSAAPSAIDQRLIAANTRFGFKLIQHLADSDDEKNIFISPTSIALVLTLLYNGAAGATQDSLATTLELQNLSPAEVNQGNAQLLKLLRAPAPQLELQVANAIWTQAGLNLKPEFRKASQAVYGAEVASTDFSSPQAMQTINQWVSEHTQGKIPTLFDQLDPQTVAVLANALYFKGAWQEPFDPQLTHEFPFTRPDGSTKQVPMMIRGGQYRYVNGDTFQAIALHYKGERISLYVFVPKGSSNLQALLKDLSETRWDSWMAQFHDEHKILWLPKFTLTYDVMLNDALAAQGMGIAFDAEQADFSRMVDGPLAVSLVKHKTFVEVNEVGTEAAAVTGAATAGGEPDESMFMKVDRPFLVAIRDDVTGTILFLGAINDPVASK